MSWPTKLREIFRNQLQALPTFSYELDNSPELFKELIHQDLNDYQLEITVSTTDQRLNGKDFRIEISSRISKDDNISWSSKITSESKKQVVQIKSKNQFQKLDEKPFHIRVIQ